MANDERPDPREVVGENVRRLRQLRGWTQERLAHEAGKHRTYVGGVERAERNTTIEALFDIAYALDVDPRELLRPRDEFEYP